MYMQPIYISSGKDNSRVTPLHVAAILGLTETAAALLDAGAEVDAISKDMLAQTPAHKAAYYGMVETFALLVSRGAVVDTWDGKKETPAHTAARGNRVDI